MFFRQNHNLLRTVHFQFLERPEGVPMLRALMNNDLPQNKKVKSCWHACSVHTVYMYNVCYSILHRSVLFS